MLPLKKKGFIASVAALAMAVGGLGIGAGVANALDAPTDSQLQVSGFEADHTYKVYRIGDYAVAPSDSATKVAVIATPGASDAVKTAAASAAADTVDPLTNTPAADTGDYVAWAAGLLPEGATGLESGDLRKVANYLTSANLSGVAIDQAATDAIAQAITDKTDPVNIDVAPGWYVITNDYATSDNPNATGVSTVVGTKYGTVAGAQGLAKLKPTDGNDPDDKTKDNLQKKMEGAVIKDSTATFTITANMPDTANWTKETASYKFIDHASALIAVDPSTIKVTVAGTEVDPAAVVTPTAAPAEGTAQDYTIDISAFVQAHIGEFAGEEIKVTYDAKVLQTADPEAAKAINSVDIIKNGVKVPTDPGTDPDPDNPGTDTQITTGDNSGVKIVKTDVNNKKLEGALFKLTNAAGTVEYAKDLKTDTNGEINIATLGVGAYKLVETQAPDTYNTPLATEEAIVFNVTATVVHETADDDKTQIIKVTVNKPVFEAKGTDTNGDTFTTADKWDFFDLAAATDEAPATATVKNVQNISQLPLTGAAGVILFGIIAALLAAGAVTMVTVSNRNKKAGLAL